MIDLHTHTNQSDGTCTPEQLINKALEIGLEALAISDHDTFAGYDQAVPLAAQAGLELICGIELSTRVDGLSSTRGRSVHLLGYFLDQGPSQQFRTWLLEIQENRRERNRDLIAKLQSLGISIGLEEVQTIGGNLTGRPHFAKILLQKGYVSSVQKAFDIYLADSAKAHVERVEPNLPDGIRRIREAGGFTSLAHPIRFGKGNLDEVDRVIMRCLAEGAPLDAIEVYHSDHGADDCQAYLALCEQHGLAVTAGSDFHGDTKPGIELGSGRNGNVSIPKRILDAMRAGLRSRL